ncbi:expressed unknown protein [Seminavis robusta]|uniref:Uncharacterized protein n=1 Tax=Seminavis robusta TaxID=568900 RepID=A0A9N8HK80_9STRA|nr:expressed unknown protein [Seminavis robusta]|eukprot:Sro712_g191390.1 n/a (235) ;mRNA; f:34971-35675
MPPLPQRVASYDARSPMSVTDLFSGGLTGFGGDEVYEPRRNVKRNMSFEMKRAVESLEYSDADLELLAGDSRQFEVLKQSLRKKGAVTNEVLKQKLPLYLKYKKDRLAKSHPEVAEALRQLPGRSRSGGLTPVARVERQSLRKPVNRVLSAKEKADAGGSPDPTTAAGTVLGRILRPKARGAGGGMRGTLGRSSSGTSPRLTASAPGGTPTRATPTRASSFSDAATALLRTTTY